MRVFHTPFVKDDNLSYTYLTVTELSKLMSTLSVYVQQVSFPYQLHQKF